MPHTGYYTQSPRNITGNVALAVTTQSTQNRGTSKMLYVAIPFMLTPLEIMRIVLSPYVLISQEDSDTGFTEVCRLISESSLQCSLAI